MSGDIEVHQTQCRPTLHRFFVIPGKVWKTAGMKSPASGETTPNAALLQANGLEKALSWYYPLEIQSDPHLRTSAESLRQSGQTADRRFEI